MRKSQIKKKEEEQGCIRPLRDSTGMLRLESWRPKNPWPLPSRRTHKKQDDVHTLDKRFIFFPCLKTKQKNTITSLTLLAKQSKSFRIPFDTRSSIWGEEKFLPLLRLSISSQISPHTSNCPLPRNSCFIHPSVSPHHCYSLPLQSISFLFPATSHCSKQHLTIRSEPQITAE